MTPGVLWEKIPGFQGQSPCHLNSNQFLISYGLLLHFPVLVSIPQFSSLFIRSAGMQRIPEARSTNGQTKKRLGLFRPLFLFSPARSSICLT